MKILILGGTREARQLAERLDGHGHEVITSLAGRTQAPTRPPGALRSGGFGGVAGLSAYLRAARIERLIDATHPYAETISRHAEAAAIAAGVPLLRLARPPWRPAPGQDWIEAASFAEAAARLPAAASVLLTTGHGGLDFFLARRDCRFLVRLIEPPAAAPPAHARLLLARPPYRLADEIALMQEHGVTHLVSKNSGDEPGVAKLEAAARLGVAIVMIARPASQRVHGGDEVEGVDAALAWLGPATN